MTTEVLQNRLPGFEMPKDRTIAWLTPPLLLQRLADKYGPFDYDPCPHPRPYGYDGLIAEWGQNNYVNPPFNYGKDGIVAWVRKAILENQKGKNVLIVWPMPTWFDLLVKAGCEIESIGEVDWVPSDGSKKKPMNWPITAFSLRAPPESTVAENVK